VPGAVEQLDVKRDVGSHVDLDDFGPHTPR
jgi:hypothetical protein